MKKKIIYGFLAGMGALFLFFSCKKDKPAYGYLGYNYFPNNVGHWVIYNVDSIVVNPLSPNKADTFQFQIKEVIDSKIGQDTQRIVRYKRTNDTAPWGSPSITQKVWKGKLTSTEALQDEDNTILVKLIFPVKLNATWNGNAFNTNGKWNYQYTSVNTPLTVNGTNFDSTLTVLQDSNRNGLQHQFYMEEYATNVGLIFKQSIDLEALNFIGVDPANGMDSLWVPADYIYLIKNNELKQGSIIFTETYISSGN